MSTSTSTTYASIPKTVLLKTRANIIDLIYTKKGSGGQEKIRIVVFWNLTREEVIVILALKRRRTGDNEQWTMDEPQRKGREI